MVEWRENLKGLNEQPKLSNVATRDEWGENLKGLNEQPKLSSVAHMDEWGDNPKGAKPNNQNCPTLHPGMSEEKIKRA
jgi:hypothetical protein